MLKRHIKTVHTVKTKLKCDQCQTVVTTKRSLQFHMIKQHDVNVPLKYCELCGKGFKLQFYLKAHIKKIHNAQKKFPCSDCEYEASSNRMLSYHTNTAHSEAKPFQCEVCKKSFKMKGLLVTHVKQVHANVAKFSCEQCSYVTKTQFQLKVHIDSIHSNLRPFSCDTCKATFKVKSSLNNHIKSVHQKEQYPCRFCEVKFNNNTTRQSHETVVHKGGSLAKFKCEYENCDFNGKSRIDLTKHSFVHGGEKPIICVCGYSFVFESDLQHHLRREGRTGCKNAADFF